MYGAPDTNFNNSRFSPHVEEQIRLTEDQLEKHTIQNLKDVQYPVELLLINALQEGEFINNDPASSDIQKQESALRIGQLVLASNKSKDSIVNYIHGHKLEQKIIDLASDEKNTSESVQSQGEKFAIEAGKYFAQSKDRLLSAARIAGADKGFDDVMESVNPEQDVLNNKKTFWRKVADAALGIEIMIERVNNLPKRLAENIKIFKEKRVDAIRETFSQWGNLALKEYKDLRNGVLTLSDMVVEEWHKDTVNAKQLMDGVLVNIKDRAQFYKENIQMAHDAYKAFDEVVTTKMDMIGGGLEQSLKNRVIEPIVHFINHNVKEKIKLWSQSVSDILVKQGESFKNDFKTAFAEHRAARKSLNNTNMLPDKPKISLK